MKFIILIYMIKVIKTIYIKFLSNFLNIHFILDLLDIKIKKIYLKKF